MDWKGRWRNQYGSVVEITDDARSRIEGTFNEVVRPRAGVGLQGMNRGETRLSHESQFTRAKCERR